MKILPDFSRWKSRIFMIVLHILFVGSLFLLDSNLTQQTRSHPWYTTMYSLLVTITIFQYLYTAGSNPGYVMDAMRDDQMAEADMKHGKDSWTGSQRLERGGAIGHSRNTRVPPLLGLMSSASNRTCPTCRVFQPPRSEHCHNCNKCVLQFDHYCAWLGTCVGYGNHCRFWWYILAETVLCLWTSATYVTSLDRTMGSMISRLHAGAVITFLIALFIALLFLVLLLLFHSYLVVTNQTTHEVIRRKRIPKLRNVPYNVKPYSRGCARNIYSFCCAPHGLYEIEMMPSPGFLEERAKASCCDTLYFNCC